MNNSNSCTNVVKKAIDVCTPIVLKTVVDVEDVVVTCCKAEVTCNHERHGRNMRVYEFCVQQVICVEIPLRYTTETCVVESCVCCSPPSRRCDSSY